MIDNYIVDFYCHEARMVIELDGSQHFENQGLKYDEIRTEHLQERDLVVMRIPNNEITCNFRGVCEYIDLVVQSRL